MMNRPDQTMKGSPRVVNALVRNRASMGTHITALLRQAANGGLEPETLRVLASLHRSSLRLIEGQQAQAGGERRPQVSGSVFTGDPAHEPEPFSQSGPDSPAASGSQPGFGNREGGSDGLAHLRVD